MILIHNNDTQNLFTFTCTVPASYCNETTCPITKENRAVLVLQKILSTEPGWTADAALCFAIWKCDFTV